MIALAAHRRSNALCTVQSDVSELASAMTVQLASLALDCLETAVFVLETDARIMFSSRAAKRLIDDGRLCIRDSRLGSPIDGETLMLRRLVKQCAQGTSNGSAQTTFHRLGDVDDTLCLAAVTARGSEERQPIVMLFASRPCETSLPDVQQLRSHFGLTHAQAKLAVEIAKGKGLKACTQRLGIAMTTGRSHLRQIFDKTETRRQAELVRVILACRFSAMEANGAPHSAPAFVG
jgi:DNA-binding CsgD family transcriptional regulator